MKPVLMFEIYGVSVESPIFIAEETLKPDSYFSPEDKKRIAAVHAAQINKYYLFTDIKPMVQMALHVGPEAIEGCGSTNSTVSEFITENGQTICVQTIFCPTPETVDIDWPESCRFLTLCDNKYS